MPWEASLPSKAVLPAVVEAGVEAGVEAHTEEEISAEARYAETNFAGIVVPRPLHEGVYQSPTPFPTDFPVTES